MRRGIDIGTDPRDETAEELVRIGGGYRLEALPLMDARDVAFVDIRSDPDVVQRAERIEDLYEYRL